MAEGKPEKTEMERFTATMAWRQRCLAMADAEEVIEPGEMVGGFIHAAATVMATEWLADVSSLKEAWKDIMKGFGMTALLYSWSQRPDVGPQGKTSSDIH